MSGGAGAARVEANASGDAPINPWPRESGGAGSSCSSAVGCSPSLQGALSARGSSRMPFAGASFVRSRLALSSWSSSSRRKAASCSATASSVSFGAPRLQVILDASPGRARKVSTRPMTDETLTRAISTSGVRNRLLCRMSHISADDSLTDGSSIFSQRKRRASGHCGATGIAARKALK
eukprot:scaffold12262_cov121-Isochrysis_galbana.AAC.3